MTVTGRDPIAISEWIVLLAAAAMLVGFAAVSWTDVYIAGTYHPHVSGLRLVTAGPNAETLKPSDKVYGSERPGVAIVGGKSYELTALGTLAYAGLLAVPLAALGGAAVTIRALGKSFFERRTAVRQRRVLAALVMLYFVLVFPGYAASGYGVWIAAAGSVVMLIVAPAADGTFAPWKMDFSNLFR